MTKHSGSSSLVVSTCLLFFINYASGISVTFGTSGGPIVPPAPPKPSDAPKPPFDDPAPVWENQSHDVPNPNPYKPTPAPFPRIFPSTPSTTAEPSTPRPAGQKLYTHIQYNVPKPQPQTENKPPAYRPQTSAQRFVQAYLPRPSSNTHEYTNEKKAQDGLYQVYETTNDVDNHLSPGHVRPLGVKYIPAFGPVYFTPEQYYDPRKFIRLNIDDNERRHNEIHTNEINDEPEHSNDFDLKFDKVRVSKSLKYETSVPQSPYTYYPRQYFYPAYPQN